ncbi:TPA: accessory Sec system protein Asp3 [Streptococcus suis]
MKVSIRWKYFIRSAYSYGSTLRFEDGKVYFENPLMPPSFELNRWESLTNFQSRRVQPQLPLLKKGVTYRLDLKASVYPTASVYVQVEFFNRYREKIDFVILKDSSSEFTYPKEAYSYEIALINAGCSEMEFTELILEEKCTISDTLESYLKGLNSPAQTGVLNIIFLEEKRDLLEKQPILSRLMEELKNVILIDDDSFSVLNQQHQEYIAKCIHDEQFHTARLISYGPKGNFASLFYKHRLPKTQVYSSLDFWSESRYLEELTKIGMFEEEIVTILAEKEESVFYAGLANSGLKLVAHLFDPLEALLEFEIEKGRS